MSRSTVVIELADDVQFARDLSAGGVFVTGTTLAITEECDLVVRGANDELRLPARVVYVDAQRGAGLELIGFCPELKAQLAALEPMPPPPVKMPRSTRDDAVAVSDAPWADETGSEAGDHWHGIDDWLGVDDLPRGEPSIDTIDEPLEPLDELVVVHAPRLADDHHSGHTEPLARIELDLDDLDDSGEIELLQLAEEDPLTAKAVEESTDELPATELVEPDEPRERFAKNVNERLRGLNLNEQLKLASSGELHERIVLERMYGKNVWETLLRNPRLSAPEVARIARMGALPRPLIELIVANPGWLAAPEVRRALLSNPRLGTDQIVKVLRLLPKHELKLAAVQTAYPQTVRQAAKQLMKD